MMSCPSKTSNAKNRIQKLLMIPRFATPLSLFLCFGNFTLEEVAEKKSKEEGECTSSKLYFFSALLFSSWFNALRFDIQENKWLTFDALGTTTNSFLKELKLISLHTYILVQKSIFGSKHFFFRQNIYLWLWIFAPKFGSNFEFIIWIFMPKITEVIWNLVLL